MADYLTELFNLTGKRAVLTGAAGFLIGEMAEAFARAGVRVLVADRDLERAEQRVASIRSHGGTAVAHQLDVTRKDQHEAALQRALAEFGGVDILVNGAGINAPTPFLEFTVEQWHSIIDVHVTGTMLGCQVIGGHMVSAGGGAILNISSASAGPPLSKAFAYSVAKAGVKNLTQNLGREWAKSGVRVNALRPGFFPTEWSKQHFLSPGRIEAILNHTPMGRFGDPKELVGAVLWLCSDAATFVTGAEIAVDGGFSAMTI